MNDILEYKGYYANIHFSVDDEVFYGKLIGINDLVTFEGDAVKELKQAFIEAVDDYLETCKEVGKAPEKTYKGVFNVRITPEMHKQAAIIASLKNVTLNEFVKSAIDATISKEKHYRELA